MVPKHAGAGRVGSQRQKECRMIQKFIVAACCLVAVALVSETSIAQVSQGNLPNQLFSQYTTQGGASSAAAGMYPAPHPVPRNVGGSYYTYQPLMPHEMLYTHSRNYFNYHNDSSYYGGGGSLNITSVRWQNGAGGVAPFPGSNQRLQSLQYKLAKKAYCIGGDCGGGGGHFGGGKLRGRLGSIGGGCVTCGN